jgi:hypothetical protein
MALLAQTSRLIFSQNWTISQIADLILQWIDVRVSKRSAKK